MSCHTHGISSLESLLCLAPFEVPSKAGKLERHSCTRLTRERRGGTGGTALSRRLDPTGRGALVGGATRRRARRWRLLIAVGQQFRPAVVFRPPGGGLVGGGPARAALQARKEPAPAPRAARRGAGEEGEHEGQPERAAERDCREHREAPYGRVARGAVHRGERRARQIARHPPARNRLKEGPVCVARLDAGRPKRPSRRGTVPRSRVLG